MSINQMAPYTRCTRPTVRRRYWVSKRAPRYTRLHDTGSGHALRGVEFTGGRGDGGYYGAGSGK